MEVKEQYEVKITNRFGALETWVRRWTLRGFRKILQKAVKLQTQRV
jgi:hypothetical protein